MPLLLLVDDDSTIIRVLKETLDRYQTISASDGEGALYQLKTHAPDLILLDLGLPGMDGALVLGRIRDLSMVPVIVLSARSAQVDKVLSLKMGADDFISKPFDIYDLEARVETVLRRCARIPIRAREILHVGTFAISHEESWINEVLIHLTPTEHRIVHMLVEHEGQMVTRDEISESLWGVADSSSRHLVDSHVGRARGRLGAVEGAPLIVTVRNKGFTIHAG